MKAIIFDLSQQRIHDAELPSLPEVLVTRGRAPRIFIGAMQPGPDKSHREYYEATHLEISWAPTGEVVVEDPVAQESEELQILTTLVLAAEVSRVGAPTAAVVSAIARIEDLRRLAENPEGLAPEEAAALRAIVGLAPRTC